MHWKHLRKQSLHLWSFYQIVLGPFLSLKTSLAVDNLPGFQLGDPLFNLHSVVGIPHNHGSNQIGLSISYSLGVYDIKNVSTCRYATFLAESFLRIFWNQPIFYPGYHGLLWYGISTLKLKLIHSDHDRFNRRFCNVLRMAQLDSSFLRHLHLERRCY